MQSAQRVDVVLLVFGTAALLGIWAVGLHADRWLRPLVLASLGTCAIAALMLGLLAQMPGAVLLAVALWGLAFGDTATLFQTACARTAGAGADVAQSMLVTVWNLGIACGGLAGAFLLQTWGAQTFAWTVLALMGAALAIAAKARAHGFA